ncbi:MAG: hypothetical protein ACRD22_17865 [Terriglobia bacterium]
MKSVLAGLAVLALLSASAVCAQHILTNKDVVDMVSAKLSDAVIVDEIHKSQCKFSTAPDDLIALKKAGVSDVVIEAMSNAGSAAPGTQPPANANAPAASVVVPDGTPVEVELKATVSSEDLEEGSVIDFTVVHPVVVNGVTVIAQGAPATARVIKVKKARHWGRSGQISWAMNHALAVDDSQIPLRFSKESKGGGSSGKVAAAVVVTSIVFWPAAPVWGLKKGHPAVLPAGKRFDVFVDGNASVKTSPATAQ